MRCVAFGLAQCPTVPYSTLPPRPKFVRNWALDWDNKLLAKGAPREAQWTTNPELCPLNAGQTWSDSEQRWIGGKGGVRGPAYYGCKQYATAQANFFGAKPRMLSFSFVDTMVGFSLRRGVLGTTDGRWYPYASRRAHSFNGGLGGHPIGWGRSLFDCASRPRRREPLLIALPLASSTHTFSISPPSHSPAHARLLW